MRVLVIALIVYGCADATNVEASDAGEGDFAPFVPPKDAGPDGPPVADGELPDLPPVDPDQDGDGTPNEDDCAPQDALRFPGANERCNGLDDDCDGDADEGVNRSCYEGPEETAGAGACQLGTETCTDGEWSACEGQVLPEPAEICDSVDNDCDGRVDEALGFHWPDLDDDGFGDGNANATCEEGDDTAPNGDDCDDDAPEVNPAAEDLPDPTFVDTNCDDVDGTAAEMLFVDDDADPALGQGTRDAPFPTIREALEAAAARDDVTRIAVSAGEYPGGLRLLNGVHIHGGYDAAQSWSRARVNAAVVTSDVLDADRIVAVRALDIVDPTLIDLLTIGTVDHPEPGGSTYALYAINATALTLQSLTIRPGAGGDGTPGEPGNGGLPGDNGQRGGDCGGPRGAGGASGCGATGGEGGDGGSRGNHGVAGAPPGCGGDGGVRSGGVAGATGGNGCNGADQPPSPDGAADPGAHGEDRYWRRGDGANGGDGVNGGVGGGGGGGSGAAVIDGTGGAGGGGGAGGCAGEGGGGGLGGGHSFGIYAIESAGLVIRDCNIETGRGGTGADGAEGGVGAGGGDGAPGGNGREAFACGGAAGPGAGGHGGRGGRGGNGGVGAGGSGGSTYPLVCIDGAVDVGQDTILRPGPGGAAGGGPGASGHMGASVASVGCEAPPDDEAEE